MYTTVPSIEEDSSGRRRCEVKKGIESINDSVNYPGVLLLTRASRFHFISIFDHALYCHDKNSHIPHLDSPYPTSSNTKLHTPRYFPPASSSDGILNSYAQSVSPSALGVHVSLHAKTAPYMPQDCSVLCQCVAGLDSCGVEGSRVGVGTDRWGWMGTDRDFAFRRGGRDLHCVGTGRVSWGFWI
jgi:hypothetical protein